MGININQVNNNQNLPVPDGLFNKIILRIAVEQKLLILRRRFAGVALLLLLSLAGTVPAWQAFWSDITSSGFSQYLALLFYNLKIVAVNWQDFLLSLLETLPIISAAALLLAIMATLVALKFAVKYGAPLISKPTFKFSN
ncbi:hypothetical protein COU00_01050 [Candidatus Falkowbacteria bacterium CG10_big_fil_rev_8_21_14_0_10_43_11]|uniref:Uncharacterized protein n=1 Tax=Candidatus Falkowbacteria bacterium CG10_big_fil_rev_8_21_14_0_10_43_11 TaxID=1974568 RepID=A0A2M6WML7_9BACT|nr:MAG: hypothetical protein COU00_01050 [Candidatus Falkowbacteria bacterium CG10_big_fil_rev_8_21_14_0_10_43_11]